MKNLYNPTDNRIEVQISGIVYSVEPKSTVSLPEEAAKYWVHSLHGFMLFVDSPMKEVVEEEKKEVVEVKEEVKEVKDSVVKKVVKKLKK